MNLSRCKGVGKKLTAFLLCALMIFSILPTSVFAWTSSEGVPCDAYYGNYIVGSDGGYYYSASSYYTLTYLNSGGTRFDYHAGNVAQRHFVLELNSGETRWVYCIESGIAFGDTTYTSKSHENSSYFQMLPYEAQWGIMLVSLYGWQPGKSVPSALSGLNADDYYMASQAIVWEYQQQIRTNPTSRHNNGQVRATQYYEIVQGRPAERAYNWILEQLSKHLTAPSFTSTNEGSAPTHKLKYDPDTKLYSLTLTDTNNLNIDLNRISGSSDITVTRSGNKYTFTSSKMITSPVLLKYQKDVPTVSEGFLIWGDPAGQKQTMMTGAEDPVFFFAKFETETWGTAKLIKTSEDNIVEGISFDITGYGETTRVTTGAGGVIETKLLPGTYTVSEVPVDRYVIPASQTITIQSGQTTTFSFNNVLKKFRVEVTKTDAKTGVAQGDASFAGAVYGIYHNGDLVDSYTTDANGQFTTKYYICSTNWTIKEISPSEGYLLDPTVYTVGADPKLYSIELNTTKNSVLETVKMGKIRIIKHIDKWDEDIDPDEQDPGGNTGIIEQPEAGAKFQIFLKSAGSYDNAKATERDILVTDSDGMALSKDLPYGRYVVHQIEGMEGQSFVPDFTVFVRENEQTYSYILNNNTITGRVRIEKHDAETGKIIPLSGVGFKVRDMSTGEFISQTVYYPNPVTHEIYYTSDEGWLMLPDELDYGNYELIEVETAYGYVLDSTPVPFKIDGEDAVVVVVKKNMPQKGKILISKTGEVFYSVSETEGIYQPIYEVTGLAGATYDIIADEDIITGDGTLRAAKGDVVDTVTTTENGAESKLLYLGRYRIVERQAPEGMVLNGEEFLVELTYAGQEVEVTTTDLSVYNERQKVEIDLLKSMETDKLFGIGQSEEYQAISFGLYAEKDLLAVDGSIIPADGLIEVVSLDPESIGVDEETGTLLLTAKFASDLPFGSFYLQERTTDGHYKIIDTKFLVLFEYQGQDTAIVSISANDGKPIENDLIRGRVAGLKVDEDGEGLADAVIGIFRPDTKEFTEETALVVTKSAEDGSFSFEDIPVGHWVVREIAPPEAFVLSDEIHHVYVGMDEQVINIRIENTLIRGTVQLVKVDSEYPDKRLSGAIFEVYQDVNGDKKFDKDDVLIGVMDEPDTGLHEMRGLIYGNYFVIEKQSPENFKPDTNPYYFEIRVDGEVVRVTNSDADGFVNEAMKGSLKIIKTSSDGKKEGFTFKVESKELGYSETFVTDKNGEIFIESLRVGKYTVTEVQTDATKGYKLPDPVEIEIIADQTLEVRVHNDKVTVDVPKTGDDTNLIFWLILLGAGLAGCVTAAVLAIKKKKKIAVPETEPPATE